MEYSLILVLQYFEREFTHFHFNVCHNHLRFLTFVLIALCPFCQCNSLIKLIFLFVSFRCLFDLSDLLTEILILLGESIQHNFQLFNVIFWYFWCFWYFNFLYILLILINIHSFLNSFQ